MVLCELAKENEMAVYAYYFKELLDDLYAVDED